MAIGVSHQLVGFFFAGGIQAERMVDVLVNRERHGGVGAIDTGTAGIHQVFDTAVAAAFQNMCKANDVAVDVGQWVVNGITYTRLGCEIHYSIWFMSFK